MLNRVRAPVVLATVALALACGSIAFAASAAAAARTYEVTRTNDPLPNACRPSDCSLREAIRAANAHPGADTVVLRSGKTYTLALVGNDDSAETGDLDVTDSVAVRTSGGQQATIDANSIDRIFDVQQGTRRTSLSNLVLREGVGAVRSDGRRLAISRCKIRNNTTSNGTGGVGTYRRLTMTGTEVSHNIGGIGGVTAGPNSTISNSAIIDNEGQETGGLAIGEAGVLHNSRVSANRIGPSPAGNPVGGIVAYQGLRVTDSQITGNDGRAWTGAVLGRGEVSVRRSLVARNMGGLPGIYLPLPDTNARIIDSRLVAQSGNYGPVSAFEGTRVTVLRSTLARNHVEVEGGAIAGFTARIALRQSTVNDNSAVGGGGISMREGSLKVTNSTIANNNALYGGGIAANNGATVKLNAATVVRNQVNQLDASEPQGGGLLLFGGTFSVGNSLIALNSSNGGTGPDCEGAFVSLGHNMLTDLADCTGFAGDPVVGNPRIGQLRNNGGPTQTVGLKKRSPAIGKADRRAPGKDQRGRKRDRKPDIGAFERT